MVADMGTLWKTQPSTSEPFCRALKIASRRRVIAVNSTMGFLPMPAT